jgi:hypothetical protein
LFELIVRNLCKTHRAKILVSGTILVLVAAGIFGQLSRGNSDYLDFLQDTIPNAESFTQLHTSNGTTLYQAGDETGRDLGFITAAEAPGYGGPMSVLVAWTNDGVITSVNVPRHFEDLPWWKALIKGKFLDQYVGRSFSEPLQLSADVDATTGSTVSSNGVAIGVRSGRLMLAEYLGKPYSGPQDPIRIGIPEFAVGSGLLFVVLARTLPGLRQRNWPRIFALMYGFMVIGLWLSIPLSLTNIAAWLVGYAPHIQTFFVIYIVVFGVIGLAAILGKNYYCYWLCPYSAVQESLHFIFRGHIRPDLKWYNVLHQVRYVLLFLALFLALALRNPSISVFEPWNVLFSLKGTPDQWILMILALTAAMFVYNFWCHFLCPVGAVLDIALKARKGIVGLWPKHKTETATSVMPTS